MSPQSDTANDFYRVIEDHFRVRGFADILITGSGGRWADVYAFNPETKSFALVEGKTEKNCSSGEDSKYRYRDHNCYLRRNMPRGDMWTIVKPCLPPSLRTKCHVAHAFAVTIWHQLYCYYRDIVEGECHSRKVKDKWVCTSPPTFQSAEPYVVVPLQHTDALGWVIREFHAQGWLPQIEPVVQNTPFGIAVARIYYASDTPCDLSAAV